MKDSNRNLVFRSFLFYAWYIPSGAAVVVFSLLLSPILPVVWRLRLVAVWQLSVIEWLRISCGIRYSVEGIARIPPPPYVVVSNHQGQWEAFYFQALFHPLIVVVKRELLSVPFFGWALAKLRPIAIERDKPRQAARKIFIEGADRLGQGLSILLFPEGTRMAPGVLGKYRRSSLALAMQNAVPIVPVVHNSGDCWPAHHFIKYPGTIRVVIGEPVVPAGQNAGKMDEIVTWAEISLKKIRETVT